MEPTTNQEKRQRRRGEDVIRKDDHVRVVIPKFVARVGYPKSVDDYVLEVRQKHGTAIDALFREVLGSTHMDRLNLDESRPSRWRISVERELAHALARKCGFGGCERTIHWLELPELEGAELRVWWLRNAFTGSYYPPSGGGWVGEDWDDYEPGGLDKKECHRLAEVSIVRANHDLRKVTIPKKLVIPVYHLAKVEMNKRRRVA